MKPVSIETVKQIVNEALSSKDETIDQLEDKLQYLTTQFEEERVFNHEKNKIIDSLCQNLDGIVLSLEKNQETFK